MKIIFLGTNGWYTSPTGNTPCILIDSKTQYVVFDAGNGIYKLDKYITEYKPISLFISHFHIDHVSGLHTLGKFSFSQGIDVYVGSGRKKDFETLVNPPYTIGFRPDQKNISNLKTEIRLHELSDGKHNINFPVSVIELFHAYRNHGFRVTLDDKIIAYSGDCGINDKSKILAKNVDLLIHESGNLKPGQDANWGHTSPVEAATLAKESNVKRLILTHFGSSLYPTLAKRKNAEIEAKKIFSNTIAALDDLVLEI